MENNSSITTLHNLLDYDSCKFTSAEIQLQKELHDWINTAGSLKLKAVLEKYLDFIKQHVQKLETFFEEERQINSLSLENRIMRTFIEETNERLSHCADQPVKDACLLACIQAINHFKISIYGSAAAFAKALGMEKASLFFHEIEVDEKHIDDRLSQLAEFEIDAKAITPIVIP